MCPKPHPSLVRVGVWIRASLAEGQSRGCVNTGRALFSDSSLLQAELEQFWEDFTPQMGTHTLYVIMIIKSESSQQCPHDQSCGFSSGHI